MNFGGRIAVGDVLSLMRHAPKSASYKPALLKALVRACGKHATPEISLETLGAEFTAMYWNQTVVYHLRQAASLSKESVAVKLIREMARIHNVRILSDLPQAARLKLDRQMARLLPVNVLDAFHSTKPQGMSAMYEWHAGSSSISIAPGVRDFINQNAATLELIANYYWAEFLERTNLLAPKILRKVATNAAKRASLQRYLKILRPEWAIRASTAATVSTRPDRLRSITSSRGAFCSRTLCGIWYWRAGAATRKSRTGCRLPAC